MARTRRTEKVVEIHEFYVVRSASGSLPALCARCSTRDGILVSPEQAAVLTGVPVRIIYSWVETGVIHYTEGSNGSVFVCVNSLVARSNHDGEE